MGYGMTVPFDGIPLSEHREWFEELVRLDDLEDEAPAAPPGMSRQIHDIKRQLLTARRAIWPQRDLLNALLRDESPHIRRETRVYLRDTYDHAVQLMDMVETFREHMEPAFVETLDAWELAESAGMSLPPVMICLPSGVRTRAVTPFEPVAKRRS